MNDKNEAIPSILTSELKESQLTLFEEYVNQENGCWIVLDKILPPEEEDSKKGKKAPPGKKQAQVDVEKPMRAKAWINFADLKKPGGTQSEQRLLFETVKLSPKIPAEGEAKEEPDKTFENAKTYIHIKLSLSNPVNPVLPKEGIPKPSDLVKKKQPLPKYPVLKDASEMYNLQLKIAVEALAKEYLKILEKPLSSALPSGKEQSGADKDPEKVKQLKKEDFVEELNRSGKYFLLKEKVKKAAVRIAKEKYSKETDSLKGVSKDKKDLLYSQLYTYLIDQMHLTINGLINTKKQELHEDIVASKDIAKKENDQIINKLNKETYIQRYQRLFKEYYRAFDYVTAERYIVEILKLQERDIPSWVKYAKFAMKIGNAAKSEECLREALSIDMESFEVLLSLAATQITRKRYSEALVFIQAVLRADFKNILANALASIMYKFQDKEAVMKRYFEVAKRQRMRELNLIPPIGTLKSQAPLLEPTRLLTDAEVDSIYFSLIDFLLSNKQVEMAEISLTFIQDKESVKYHMCLARAKFTNGAYAECLLSIEKLLLKEPRNQRALKYKGHCLLLLGKLKESEAAYLKAIRIIPPPKSYTLYERLGQSYIKMKMWPDAKVVFTKCCADPKVNTSNSWKKLGLSYLMLDDYENAEKALSQANLLDTSNAEVWGYLTLFCLREGSKKSPASTKANYSKAIECFSRAVQIDFLNSSLMEKSPPHSPSTEDSKEKVIKCFVQSISASKDPSQKGEIIKIMKNIIGICPTSPLMQELIQVFDPFIPFQLK